MNLVLDTNIIISALIRNGKTRKFIVESENNFLLPEFEFSEIESHKEEVLQKSGLSLSEFEVLLLTLLRYVQIVKNKEIADYKKRANEIMKNIDPDDAIFIATALAKNSAIWSDDKHFQKQKAVKIFTTKDILDNF